MLRAFLVAPIGAASVYAALVLIDPFYGQGAAIGALWIAAAVVATSYVAEAVIALPAFSFFGGSAWRIRSFPSSAASFWEFCWLAF